MKTFIYGRPAVEKGDRGYRVFKYENLGSEETKRLKELFSDEDPDVRALDKAHFEPFYAYFPWREDLWIFGKGKIETGGRLGAMYYSYLFHGVVLGETDREALRYNPFVLSECFDVDGASRTSLPRLPQTVNEKGYYLNLIQKAAHLCARDQGALAVEAGELVAHLLAEEETPRLFFPHRGDWDGTFWGCVYFLLPPIMRQSLSLATWGPFLHGPVRLCGGTSDGHQLTLRGGTRSVFAEVLLDLGRSLSQEEAARSLMDLYEKAATELIARGLKNAASIAFLESLFRAVERPSVRSLSAWPPVGPHLLAVKLAHLSAVWEANRGELEHFPDLADRIWRAAYGDFVDLDESAARAHVDELARLYQTLGTEIGGTAAADVLAHAVLAECLAQTMGSETFLGALLYADLRDADFRNLMTRLVRAGTLSQSTFRDLVRVAVGKLGGHRRQAEDIACWGPRLDLLAELDGPAFDGVVATLIYERRVLSLPLNASPLACKRMLCAWAAEIARDSERLVANPEAPSALGRIELARLRLTALSARYPLAATDKLGELSPFHPLKTDHLRSEEQPWPS